MWTCFRRGGYPPAEGRQVLTGENSPNGVLETGANIWRSATNPTPKRTSSRFSRSKKTTRNVLLLEVSSLLNKGLHIHLRKHPAPRSARSTLIQPMLAPKRSLARMPPRTRLIRKIEAILLLQSRQMVQVAESRMLPPPHLLRVCWRRRMRRRSAER